MTVALGSKACTVFYCSDTEIVGLNSTHGRDTLPLLAFCVCAVQYTRGLTTG